MLRSTYINLKKACAYTFVPRMWRGHLKNVKSQKLSCVTTAKKSTMSNSRDGNKRKCDKCEKCERIIKYVFGTGEYPASDIKGFENFEAHKNKLAQIVAPQVHLTNETKDEKREQNVNDSFEESKHTINQDKTNELDRTMPDPMHMNEATRNQEGKIFDRSNIFDAGRKPLQDSLFHPTVKVSDKKVLQRLERLVSRPGILKAYKLDKSTLRASTTKEDKDGLAQKIEKLEEPSIVGAEKSNIEGFNTFPKVLEDKPVLESTNTRLTRISSLKADPGNRNEIQHYFKAQKPKRHVWEPYMIPRKPKVKTFNATSSHIKDQFTYFSKNRESGSFSEYDEIAQRCVQSPSNKLYERVLDETEKLVPIADAKSPLNKRNVDGELTQTNDADPNHNPPHCLSNRNDDMIAELKQVLSKRHITKKSTDQEDLNRKKYSQTYVPHSLDRKLSASRLARIVKMTPKLASDKALIDPFDKRTIAKEYKASVPLDNKLHERVLDETEKLVPIADAKSPLNKRNVDGELTQTNDADPNHNQPHCLSNRNDDMIAELKQVLSKRQITKKSTDQEDLNRKKYSQTYVPHSLDRKLSASRLARIVKMTPKLASDKALIDSFDKRTIAKEYKAPLDNKRFVFTNETCPLSVDENSEPVLARETSRLDKPSPIPKEPNLNLTSRLKQQVMSSIQPRVEEETYAQNMNEAETIPHEATGSNQSEAIDLDKYRAQSAQPVGCTSRTDEIITAANKTQTISIDEIKINAYEAKINPRSEITPVSMEWFYPPTIQLQLKQEFEQDELQITHPDASTPQWVTPDNVITQPIRPDTIEVRQIVRNVSRPQMAQIIARTEIQKESESEMTQPYDIKIQKTPQRNVTMIESDMIEIQPDVSKSKSTDFKNTSTGQSQIVDDENPKVREIADLQIIQPEPSEMAKLQLHTITPRSSRPITINNAETAPDLDMQVAQAQPREPQAQSSTTLVQPDALPESTQPETTHPVPQETIEREKEALLNSYAPPLHEKIQQNISASIGPLPVVPGSSIDEIPLSQLLLKARMRSRMQYSKTLEDYQSTMKPVEGKCGQKPPPCPPKVPTCPPEKPVCPPKCPPKPKCPPPPPKCPPPCPPKKKPCGCGCCCVALSETVTMALQSAPTFKPRTSFVRLVSISSQKPIVEELHALEQDLLRSCKESKATLALAREYDPWTPIPCWPYPVKQDRKALVCPKDGCKIIPPPKDGDFCKPKEKPCTQFPKRLTFSSLDVLGGPSGSKNLYDIGEF